MKNVVAYCRVSTDGQVGDDKYGLDVQKEQIQEYCNKNDMNVVEWFVDEGISGAIENRPELDKILFGDDVNNPPYESVIISKNDRMARDINIYFYYKMMLKKKNITLVSISEDFGQFGAFSSILEAFTLCVAELERVNIHKRTSAGRGTKARMGGYAGGRTPYGYSVSNGCLVINEEESKMVRFIFKQRDSGLTLQDIADLLADQGINTRKGKRFHSSTIKSIVDNRQTYEGMYKYGKDGIWVKGQHESILKKEGE